MMVASISSWRLSKTRKMVPSATPAASATYRVVTAVPTSWMRGSVASMMAALRCSRGMGAARVTRESILSEHSLIK